ncbi:hypothetical protein AAFC00_005541 [Neodothiora populina]|uniref:Zn(2)-C6 fungal-type domain-containing protein n=1 Tax=Neodothiora populina TaxID=2781224 RepID=A0ABR3PL97_9PEZI
MGRKPNALILEFFERGPKLNDQSNRYQHTCRRCGEVFPKGRPDSLIRHLFEKCPKITQADRARALWQPAETPSHHSQQQSLSGINNTNGQYGQLPTPTDMLPFATQREPSGLDALAEVSRQLQANGQVVADDNFIAQLQQHMDEDEDVPSVGDPHARIGASFTPSTTPPNLDETAVVSTNEQLAEAAMQHSRAHGTRGKKRKASPAPDPTIPNSYLSYYAERPPPAVDPLLRQHSADNSPPTAHFNDDQTSSFAMTHGGFGLLQRANKSKARGRFSEERRKEVQNVRKKGACLRCRMLKKPCSEGTPCGTCKNIEAARLWKGACIRTRVADEFALYSTAYFYSKDRAKVYASLNGNEPQSVAGRIEATLFPESNSYGTFPALKTNRCGHLAEDGFDPELVNHRQDDSPPADIYLLSFKTEDTLAVKLERYINAAVPQCIAAEVSPIINATLEMAVELSAENNDALMTKFVHLWCATNILVSQKPLWTIAYNGQDQPLAEHVLASGTKNDHSDSSDNSVGSRLIFHPESEDYHIMHAQLQDAAERYCQKQAKVALNELERRLLQRQQSSTFLTFLSAVIMLNCVERMTALYRSFDPVTACATDAGGTKALDATRITITPDSENGAVTGLDNHGIDTGVSSEWPLPNSPSNYWPQGYRFAELLQLLLRMRGLPPTIHISDDDTLSVISTINKALPVVISPDTEGADSQQQLAAKWIERTGLKAKDLWTVHGLSDQELNKLAWEGEEAKGARAWDLKFLAPLLLPV